MRAVLAKAQFVWLAAALTAAAQDVPVTGAPFWDMKAPAEWTIEEVGRLLEHSPWATVSKGGRGEVLAMHVATAEPMKLAEVRERQARRRRAETGLNFEEYEALLAEGKYIVLAVRLPDAKAVSDASESRTMEKDSVLTVGRRTYKVVTHFPPTDADPYLRYVFPRDVRPGDKALLFDVFVPGVVNPQRRAEFDLRGMTFHGKVEY